MPLEHKISVHDLKKRYNFTSASHDFPCCVAHVPIVEGLHIRDAAIAQTRCCNCSIASVQSTHAAVRSKETAKMASSAPIHAPMRAYEKARPCREAQAGSFLINSFFPRTAINIFTLPVRNVRTIHRCEPCGRARRLSCPHCFPCRGSPWR